MNPMEEYLTSRGENRVRVSLSVRHKARPIVDRMSLDGLLVLREVVEEAIKRHNSRPIESVPEYTSGPIDYPGGMNYMVVDCNGFAESVQAGLQDWSFTSGSHETPEVQAGRPF